MTFCHGEAYWGKKICPFFRPYIGEAQKAGDLKEGIFVKKLTKNVQKRPIMEYFLIFFLTFADTSL